MEMKRTIYPAERKQEKNITLEAENGSEVRPTALHMPTIKLQCKRVL